MVEARATAKSAVRVLAMMAVELLVMLRSVEAATYTVGDNTGWSSPTNGASFYSSWASSHTFNFGDILVFNFISGQHDVAVVSASDFNSCNTGSPTTLLTNPPVNYTLNTTGTIYFICTHDSHCSQGQKLSITVGTASGPTTSPPSTTSPPGTTSSPPPPPPPPRANSSTGYIHVSYLVTFTSMAIYFLLMRQERLVLID